MLPNGRPPLPTRHCRVRIDISRKPLVSAIMYSYNLEVELGDMSATVTEERKRLLIR